MAGRRKVAATVVALVALMGGVEIASAGVLDPVAEAPPLVAPPPIEDAAAAAEETVADGEEAVNDAAGQAAEPVAEVTETVGQVAEPITDTAGPVKEAVEDVVQDTPVGKVLDEAEQIVAPVIENPVPSLPTGQPQAAQPSDSASVSGDGSTPSDRASSGAPGAAPATTLSTGLGLDETSLTSPIRQNDATASGAARLSPQSFLSPYQLWSPPASRATGDPATIASRAGDSSGFPWPFSPSFPVDTAAVAAFAAGAAGGALTAALLAAFMLMAPGAGRWLRPGPTLGWPPPALPSLERPG